MHEQEPDGLLFWKGLSVASLFMFSVFLVVMSFVFISKWIGQHRIPEEPADQVAESVDAPLNADRSSKWSKVRNEFVAVNGVCAACGTDENLNVHHIQPFHKHPELELDWDNLITLCREHHFYIGHDPDGDGPERPNWKSSNPNVEYDAKHWGELNQSP